MTKATMACVSRVALQSKTGRVSCVCDWLRDATGLDFGERSWICNAARVIVCNQLTMDDSEVKLDLA